MKLAICRFWACPVIVHTKKMEYVTLIDLEKHIKTIHRQMVYKNGKWKEDNMVIPKNLVEIKTHWCCFISTKSMELRHI